MKNIILIVVILVAIALLTHFVVKKPGTGEVLLGDGTQSSLDTIDPLSNNTTTSVAQQPTTMNTPSSETTQKVKMTTTPSGLQYGILVSGTGAEAASGDLVTVHYTGTLTDGTKFDSSVDRGEPATFPIGVGQLIKGWDEGIPGMKIGEKRLLVIPGNLAYGATPPPGSPIKVNDTLVFEVELLAVQKAR